MTEQEIADINQLLKLQTVLEETKAHFENREGGAWSELMLRLVSMGIPADSAYLIRESVLMAHFQMHRVKVAAKHKIGNL